MSSPLGGRMSLDISEVQANITKLNRLIKENESEWRENASTMDDWSSSQDGLEGRMSSLNKQIDLQKKKLAEALKEKELVIEKYGKESAQVDKVNGKIIKYQKELERSQTELKGTQSSLDKLNNELQDEEKKTDKAEKSTKDLNRTVEKSDKSFSVATVAIGSFIANGLTALVSKIGEAISSFAGLADSTLETRKELGLLEGVAKKTGASADSVIDKWVDMTAVIGDEGAVREGISNLLSAGFTAEKEMDAITKALEGASIQWRDTLSFEGLSDSLQEWIGSKGESLTGNFAELLERLGYNLEDVTAQTKGMTDAQRRQWAITQLNKNGMSELSESYREANSDMIELEKANRELELAQAGLGEVMTPMVTMIKNSFADILYSFTDMINGVDGAKEQLFYVIGNIVGTLVKNIKTGLDMLVPLIAEAVPKIFETINTYAPMVIEQGAKFIGDLISGASEMFPTLLDNVATLVITLAQTLIDNAPTVLNAGLELIGSVVQAVFDTAPKLLGAIPELINSISNGLFSGKNSVFNSALDTLMEIVRSIPNLIRNLLNELPKIITSILNFLMNNHGKIFDGAVKLFVEICKAIPQILGDLTKALFTIIQTIIDYFKSPENRAKLLEVGKNIVKGLIEGLKSVGNMVWDGVKNVGNEIINGFKSFFGIHSPARKMADEIGEPITEGVVTGMEDAEKGVYDTIVEIGSSIGGGFGDGFADAINGVSKDATKAIGNELAGVADSRTLTTTSQEIGKSVATEISKSIKDYSSSVSSALTSIFEGDTSSLGSSLVSALKKSSAIGSVFGGVYDFVTGVLDSEEFEGMSVEEVAETIATRLLDNFNKLLDNLPELVSTGIKFMVSFAEALIKGIPEVIKKLPDIIVDICETLVKEGVPAMLQVGVDLVKGLLDGLWEGAKSIWNGIKKVGNWIVDGFKSIFGINSPSKIMADEVGKNLALGIEEGLTNNLKGVNRAISKGVKTSVELDQNVSGRKMVTVNQTNHYSQAHTRYELYKSKRDTANAVKLALQGV